MRQVVSTPSGILVEDVPAPVVEPGTVLVRTSYSCISPGTELQGITVAEAPLWRRALSDPRKATAKLQHLAKRAGVAGVRRELDVRRRTGSPLGYSAAGHVVEVGAGVADVTPGTLVACGGAGAANHAEFIRVPINLIAAVPDGVEPAHASMATLGAIALHGVRRAEPTLGETFVVVGLGVVGQLAVQILRAHGCRVLATDLDPSRVAAAVAHGAEAFDEPGATPADRVRTLTDGIGADGVLVCASSPSSDVLAVAFSLCRKKARVVLVGDTGMSLQRADLYEKELEFRISTSYGPGRYDRRYEEDGLDYPLSYVRWTEQRNLAEVVRQMADGAMRVDDLIGGVYDVTRATEAYDALRSADHRPLAVLLRYGVDTQASKRAVTVGAAWAPRPGAVRLGVIGAGSFAREVHLPNVVARPDLFCLRAVSARTPTGAVDVARRFGAAYAASDARELLADPEIDAVLVATRHDTHARLAMDALRAGKHVLVEKPLAMTVDELDELRHLLSEGEVPGLLLTGYNRRFSPMARELGRRLAGRRAPMVATYVVNAGYLPADHWTQGPQGGGRNLGEACHMYDTLRYLVGAPVVSIAATARRPGVHQGLANENFCATLTYGDGSVATVLYTALGSIAYPKERLTVFCDGQVHELVDFVRLDSTGHSTRHSEHPDKGHAEELEVFARAVQSGGPWPVPLDVQVEVAETALAVEEGLRGSGVSG